MDASEKQNDWLVFWSTSSASEQAKVRLLEPILLTEKKKEPSGLKRRRSEDEEMEDTQAKRPRVSSDEVVEIEDTEKEGVILLDWSKKHFWTMKPTCTHEVE